MASSAGLIRLVVATLLLVTAAIPHRAGAGSLMGHLLRADVRQAGSHVGGGQSFYDAKPAKGSLTISP